MGEKREEIHIRRKSLNKRKREMEGEKEHAFTFVSLRLRLLFVILYLGEFSFYSGIYFTFFKNVLQFSVLQNIIDKESRVINESNNYE